MKPPISYYGGKQSIIRDILPLIPEHEVYTESFFGGGTVFFAKKPAFNETINDRLDIVINFYQVLKLHFHELKKLIDASLVSKTQHALALKIINKKIQSTEIEKAWAFGYSCNVSWGNKPGGGVKYSNVQSITPALALKRKKERFTDTLVERIENAHIENRDALWVLNSRNVEKAFHYLDPPYINVDQGHYKGYSVPDFELLLNWSATKCKGKFLLSNYNSELLQKYIDKYGWNKKEVVKNLAKPRKSGERKIEVLVWNYTINPNLFEQDFIKKNSMNYSYL